MTKIANNALNCKQAQQSAAPAPKSRTFKQAVVHGGRKQHLPWIC